MERKLSADASHEKSAIIQTLRSNSGRVAEEWVAAFTKSSYLRGSELKVPADMRLDKTRQMVEALLRTAEDPSSKGAHEILKSSIRGEHAQSLRLSDTVKKLNLLRDVMLVVLEREMPQVPKVNAKMALDSVVDKAVQGTVLMMELYTDMQSSLCRWMLSAPDSQSSLDQSLARFCRSAMEYFEVDFVSLFRYNSSMNELVCQACTAKGIALTKDTRVKPESVPLATEALKKKKSVVFGDGEGGTRKTKVVGPISFARGVSSPLVWDENTIGLLMIGDNSRTAPLTPDEVVLVEEFARQVARVMESAELFQLLSVRSRAQAALIETAASLQREIESDEIYRIVSSKLAELIPCDEFAFYTFDWERNTATPVWATGPYAAEIMADRDFPTDTGYVGFVARSKKAEVIWDTEKDPRGEYVPGTPQQNTRMLAVPVIGSKEVLGVIELQSYPPAGFSRDDVEIATLFANHAAVALENARLVKEMQRAKDYIELHMDLLTHDIANYTTPILAYVEALRTRPDLQPEVRSMLDKTTRQIESIMRLVDMVRTMSRLRESGPRSLAKHDMAKAIKEAMKEVRETSRMKMIDFEATLPEGPLIVMADEMLKDIFLNLFYSAAMSDKLDKTKLIVSIDERVERKIEYWWVKVSQPSKSIPNQQKGVVLKMVKSSKSELTGGFGIGLAAAKGLVDRYGGNMWVSDIVPGDFAKGCVFNLMIPKAA